MSGATKAGLIVGVLATIPTFALPGLCVPVIAMPLGVLAGWLAVKLDDRTEFATTTPTRSGVKAGLVGGVLITVDFIAINVLWLLLGDGATQIARLTRELGLGEFVGNSGFDLGMWIGVILAGLVFGAITTGVLALAGAITAKVVGPDQQPAMATATAAGTTSTATWRTDTSQHTQTTQSWGS